MESCVIPNLFSINLIYKNQIFQQFLQEKPLNSPLNKKAKSVLVCVERKKALQLSENSEKILLKKQKIFRLTPKNHIDDNEQLDFIELSLLMKKSLSNDARI